MEPRRLPFKSWAAIYAHLSLAEIMAVAHQPSGFPAKMSDISSTSLIRSENWRRTDTKELDFLEQGYQRQMSTNETDNTELTIGYGSTVFRKGECHTRVRGGGKAGGNAWLARVLGHDPKFEFNRKFIRANRSDVSQSGRSGVVRWTISEPGIYEFRGCSNSSTRNAEGFFEVHEDGRVDLLTKSVVLARLSGMNQPISGAS